MLFRVSYKLKPDDESRLSTQMYALDADNAADLIVRRKMDEVLDGPWQSYFGGGDPAPSMGSTLLRAGKLAKANHALIWTSMIAVRAGVIDAWELMNDKGVVHELAHEMQISNSTDIDSVLGRSYHRAYVWRPLADRIEALERLVPGLHPSWGEEDYDRKEEERQRLKAEAEAERRKNFNLDPKKVGWYPYQEEAMKLFLNPLKGSESKAERLARAYGIKPILRAVKEETYGEEPKDMGFLTATQALNRLDRLAGSFKDMEAATVHANQSFMLLGNHADVGFYEPPTRPGYTGPGKQSRKQALKDTTARMDQAQAAKKAMIVKALGKRGKAIAAKPEPRRVVMGFDVGVKADETIIQALDFKGTEMRVLSQALADIDGKIERTIMAELFDKHMGMGATYEMLRHRGGMISGRAAHTHPNGITGTRADSIIVDELSVV